MSAENMVDWLAVEALLDERATAARAIRIPLSYHDFGGEIRKELGRGGVDSCWFDLAKWAVATTAFNVIDGPPFPIGYQYGFESWRARLVHSVRSRGDATIARELARGQALVYLSTATAALRWLGSSVPDRKQIEERAEQFGGFPVGHSDEVERGFAEYTNAKRTIDDRAAYEFVLAGNIRIAVAEQMLLEPVVDSVVGRFPDPFVESVVPRLLVPERVEQLRGLWARWVTRHLLTVGLPMGHLPLRYPVVPAYATAPRRYKYDGLRSLLDRWDDSGGDLAATAADDWRSLRSRTTYAIALFEMFQRWPELQRRPDKVLAANWDLSRTGSA